MHVPCGGRRAHAGFPVLLSMKLVHVEDTCATAPGIWLVALANMEPLEADPTSFGMTMVANGNLGPIAPFCGSVGCTVEGSRGSMTPE